MFFSYVFQSLWELLQDPLDLHPKGRQQLVRGRRSSSRPGGLDSTRKFKRLLDNLLDPDRGGWNVETSGKSSRANREFLVFRFAAASLSAGTTDP